MIKTLRITSVAAAILAALFLISLVVFGTRSNKQVQQFLSSESVIEKFNKTEGKANKSTSQISPLVTEAKKFAKYLNPPPKPEPAKPPVARKPSIPSISPPKSSAKFTLIGTSYYASQPNRSLAFIDEPGKGTRWVSQSSNVGHLTIEQVKDGIVVVRDGGRTFELSVPENRQRSLVEGTSPAAKTTTPLTTTLESTPTTSTPAAPPNAEEIERIKKLMESLSERVKSPDNIDSEEVGEIMSNIGSMRISPGEAERLKELPKELDDTQQNPNQPNNPPVGPKPTPGRKVKRPALPSIPPTRRR